MYEPSISQVYMWNYGDQAPIFQESKYARSYDNRLAASYFRGLQGLSSRDREQWEKEHLAEIEGLSIPEKDEVFRNELFSKHFRDREDEWSRDIWDRAESLTVGERDQAFAQLALQEDLDNTSRAREDYSLSLWNSQSDPNTYADIFWAKNSENLRDQAMALLKDQSTDATNEVFRQLQSLSVEEQEQALRKFDQLSEEVSSFYKTYKNTDKLNLSQQDQLYNFARFVAGQQLFGGEFAAKALGNYYQDAVAQRQSALEKAWNSGAQFIDSAAGMIIRAAGMISAVTELDRLWGDGGDEQGWLEHVINNDVALYGDRVATTNSWNPSEQKTLEELGMSDNPILGTVEQQHSLLSMNTPFELFGQYGFTTASTILSFGGGAAVNWGVKGIAWLGRMATAGKGLNTTVKGINFTRRLLKSKDIANLFIAGAVGTVEGGMNASMTYQQTIKALEQEVNNKFLEEANPAIHQYLLSKGYTDDDIGSEEYQSEYEYLMNNPEFLASYAQSNPELAQALKNREANMKAAHDSAVTGMYYDFWTNSVINGLVNATFQATLNAPTIQRSLSKFGLGAKPMRGAVDVTGDVAGGFTANVRRATKWSVIKNRLRESLGEGIEEYTQDISSAFGEAYSKDKMQQYLDNKYGDNPGATAADNDVMQSLFAGFKAAGEKATSFEAIKSGVYGGLSTLLGGPNMRVNGRGKGNYENGVAKWMDKYSPISWRSAFTPLWNNTERDNINKQREALADHLNEFFQDRDAQDAIFNAGGTSEWLRQMQEGLSSNDEKTARDARLGAMFSNIITLNSLQGTAYYDAAMASLQARANFDAKNLQDAESIESKEAQRFLQSAQNRTFNMTAEEAVETMKKQATEMLDIMDRVGSYTHDIEKIFGEDLDKDVKASMVFNRIVIDDYKQRTQQLDEEINQAQSPIAANSVEHSSLSSRGKKLIARFGSLSNAIHELSRLEESKEKMEEAVRDLEVEEKNATDPEEKGEIQMALAFARQQLSNLNANIEAIESAKTSYESLANTVSDEHGVAVADDRTVLSAEEIFNLSASDRAFMLDEKNSKLYSQEQQAEIDKVKSIGTSIHQDFIKKIEDRARIERDYRAAMASQYNLMQNPQALNIYAARAKQNAQRLMYQRKNEELVDYEMNGDYTSFAEGLETVLNRGDVAEINAVREMLGGSNFYNRYLSENQKKQDVLDWAARNDQFLEGEEAHADVLASTLDYLSNQGIDITDVDASSEALLGQEDDGSYHLENYINSINEELPADQQVPFTSIGEAVQRYKDVMTAYNKDRQQSEEDNAPIPPAPTSSDDSTPPSAPEAEPQDDNPPSQPSGQQGAGIFDQLGRNSAESGHITEDGTVVGGNADNAQDQSAQPTEQEDPIVEQFADNSNEEVAQTVKLMLKLIENIPSFETSAREEARRVLEDLSNNTFNNVQELIDAIASRANALDIDAVDGNSPTANLLRQVIARAGKKAVDAAPVVDEDKPVSPFFDKRRRALQRQNRILNYNMFPNAGPTSSTLASVNIAYIRENYPDSPLVEYYDKYGIEDALRDGILNSNPDVMFITDDSLTDQVRQNMEQSGITYTDDSRPVIAVVEAENGPITINVDGQDKHFQPISVMSSTNKLGSAGSTHMGPIRQLAQGNTGVALIRNTDGTPLITKKMGNVKAVPNDVNYQGPNNDVQSIVENDLSAEDRETLQRQTPQERRNNPIYQRAKRNFLKRLRIMQSSSSRKTLYYSQDNLMGGENKVFLFIPSIDKTQGRDTDSTIDELFNNQDTQGAINFNSRTRRAAKVISDVISNLSTGDMTFEMRDDGTIAPTGDTVSAVNAIANQIGNKVSNFLSIPIKEGWVYQAIPSGQTADGKVIFDIALVSTNPSLTPIHLTSIYEGMSQQEIEQAQYDFLKNLIMDKEGNVRMVNERDSFAKWNVSFSDVEKMGSDRMAADNISDVYDDGFLEARATSFLYTIQGIALNNPLKADGSPVFTRVSNPANAGPSQPLNTPPVTPTGQVGSNGAIIDSDTGTVLEGEQDNTNDTMTRVKEIVDKIVHNSAHFSLAEDGSGYIDNRTGKKYARVTSIIAADAQAGERFDPNSPWATPSTNIGTGVDEFVRDFFAGNVGDLETLHQRYPNATTEQLKKFAEQLQGLKSQFEANGLTIVPRDVTVSGQLEVADSNGNVHTIDVAGTLDLLAYDGKGNFYIFDMKTMRSDIDAKKAAKYARQLTMYKQLLEKQYGIQVKSLNIIPIKVDYPAPTGFGNGTANYSVSPEQSNQLLIDGREYRNASPTLNPTFAVQPSELNIVWDRLTDEEKQMFSGVQEQIAEQTGEDITPVEAQVADAAEMPVDPTLGVPIDDTIGGDLFGDDFYDNSSWDNSPGRLTPIPSHLQWDNLTQQQREGLEMMGLTETEWSDLEDQEMEHKLGCL